LKFAPPRRLVKRAASAKTKANCAKASLKGNVVKKRRAAAKKKATKTQAAMVAPVVNAATTKAASAKKMSRRRLNKISSKAVWSSFQSALHPKGEQRGELASSTRKRMPVLVGSDCSGLSTELLALEYAGIPFKSAFASECAVGVRVIHDLLHGPHDRFFHDAGDSHTKREHVDLYVAGPPCQPFSTQGVGLGFADPRGATMRHVLRYIGRGRPKVVVIENVKGLVDRHTECCLDYVLQALTREGYSVRWNILPVLQTRRLYKAKNACQLNVVIKHSLLKPKKPF